MASLLHKFNWNKVALIYSKTETATRDYEAIAKTIEATLVANKIEVRFVEKWSTSYYHGYTENPFTEIVENSYKRTRSIARFRFRFEFASIKCFIILSQLRLSRSPALLLLEMQVARYSFAF